jgi:hypothetical protein
MEHTVVGPLDGVHTCIYIYVSSLQWTQLSRFHDFIFYMMQKKKQFLKLCVFSKHKVMDKLKDMCTLMVTDV